MYSKLIVKLILYQTVHVSLAFNPYSLTVPPPHPPTTTKLVIFVKKLFSKKQVPQGRKITASSTTITETNLKC